MQQIELTYIGKKINSVQLINTKLAKNFCKKLFNPKTIQLKESFYLIALSNSNYVIGWYKVSEGQSNNCIVDLKHLTATAILSNATGVIITHNHPSGMLTPSHSDKNITNKIKKGLNLFDITLIDHVIVSHKGCYSFMDNNFF